MAIVVSARFSAAFNVVDLVRTLIFIISSVFARDAQIPCLRDPDITCVTCNAGPGYDMSTNCTTCVEPRLDPSRGCTECVEGETQCSTGNFTFSALFDSYMNPQHLCGECVENGSVCCDTVDQTDNCTKNCEFRLVFSVQPYLATALDVKLPRNPPEVHSGNIPMFPQGPNAFPITNRSNPYTAELRTWTERLQFYIVPYDYNTAIKSRFALDRFLINLELGGAPNAIPRQTYHGIYNIAQFDLSFNIRCSANYYGPQCSKFCPELVGVSTCDAMGNRICSNSSCDLSTDCLVCTTTTSLHTADITSPSSPSSSGLLVGVICTILAVILILILLTVLLFIICRQRKLKCETGKCGVVTSKPSTYNDRDISAKETMECKAYGNVSTVNPAVEIEQCNVYEHVSTLEPQCNVYEHVSTLEHTSQGLLPATTEPAIYDC